MQMSSFEFFQSQSRGQGKIQAQIGLWKLTFCTYQPIPIVSTQSLKFSNFQGLKLKLSDRSSMNMNFATKLDQVSSLIQMLSKRDNKQCQISIHVEGSCHQYERLVVQLAQYGNIQNLRW
ncbi:hypothetical protein FGO68_gene4086 [Halteria grandinella]|uniref:Uncharacterized protein n=1 Tax=Halteria grandinella TaxID=5974 RepID=A0A8J8T7C1_HALGN|nr:hypothetical protein FGO68_gene4086 [Halteria grandinella]